MSIKHSKSKRKSSTKSSSDSFQKAILQAALNYIERGWRVFPCYAAKADGSCTCDDSQCEDQGKHPYTDFAPHGFKSASNTRDDIERWFGPNAPPLNLAVATGAVSGLTVVDVDMGVDKVGDVTWRALIEEYGEPVTLSAKTGGGGIHFFFSYSADPQNGNDRLGKHVDVKNDGGYVLVAPSNHRLGGTYEWVNADAVCEAAPEWMKQKKETRGRPRKGEEKRKHYTLAEVASMLKVIPADNRDLWLDVGVILGRTFNRSDEAWALYHEWADTWDGERNSDHEKTMHTAFYVTSQIQKDKELTLGTIVHEALKHGWAPTTGAVPMSEFVYCAHSNTYLYRSTMAEWNAAGVDAVVSPLNADGKLRPASVWLKTHNPITSVICDPTIPGEVLTGFNCHEGALIPAIGANVFNIYRRPTIILGEATKADPWIQHATRMMPKPGDAEQLTKYLAHRIQHPGVKPRFALLMAGETGVGKDMIVDMAAPGMGSWNVANIEPAAFDSAFNEFAAKTLVRISETSNLQEMSKWAFNERTKVLIAGRPDEVTINVKYGQKFSHRMFCGVILTTNNLLNGIFIPADDRRYDVIACATKAEMGLADRKTRKAYFDELWAWFYADGMNHVAAYLGTLDLGDWSPTGQRITEAHTAVVHANRMNDHWLLDILDALCAQEKLKDLRENDENGIPFLKYVRADWITALAETYGEKVADVQRKLLATITRHGYAVYKNPHNKEDRWKFPSGGRIVYAKLGTPMGLDMAKKCNIGLFGENGSV